MLPSPHSRPPTRVSCSWALSRVPAQDAGQQLTNTHVDGLDFRPVKVEGGRKFCTGGVSATEPYYYPSKQDVVGAQFFAELNGEAMVTPQRGLSIGTLYNLRHGVTSGHRHTAGPGRAGRGSLIFQNAHDVMVLAEMLRVTPNAKIVDNVTKRDLLAKGLLPLTDHFLDIVLGQKWVADSRLWADHAAPLWAASALPINADALASRRASLQARCERRVDELVLAPHEVDLALGVRFPPPQSLWRHRMDVLDAALLRPANLVSAAKQLHKHLGAGFPFEILEHLRGLERRINEAAHASAQSGDTANSLDANDADYCAAPHSVSPSGHASRTPSRTRRSSVRKRRRPELSGSIDALADVCADVLARVGLVRFYGWLTRPHGLPMATPLDRWDLPNVDPLFDRLSIETYPHVSALVDHWEAHCPERTLRNTLCVCTLGVFVRLTYLLPLFCDDFDDGSGPRNHLALLHGVHEHLETGGALYTLLQGWEAAQPLPREAKKSEREALRRARYTNCTSLDAIFELLRHFRDHEPDEGKQLHDWVAEAPGLGEVFANVLIRELQLYVPDARRDIPFGVGPGSAAFLMRFGVPRAKMVDVIRAMQRKIPQKTAALLEAHPVDGLPAAARRVLCDHPLAYRVVENHCCEGLKLIRALLVGLTTWRGKPLKPPKNTFDFYKRAAPPATVRVGVLDVPGGAVTIESLDFAITAEVARSIAMRARKAQQALVAALDDGEGVQDNPITPVKKACTHRSVRMPLPRCAALQLTGACATACDRTHREPPPSPRSRPWTCSRRALNRRRPRARTRCAAVCSCCSSAAHAARPVDASRTSRAT